MRKDETHLPVIEWSASRVTAYDPATHQYHVGKNLAEVAPLLTGPRKAIVALSRRSSFMRTARVPDAPKEQVQQVLRIQMANLVPIPATDIAFDFRLSKSVNEEGRLAIIGAVSTDALSQVNRDLKEAGIAAAAIAPVAFGSALLAQSLSLETCAIVEQSPEGLAIDIIADGELRYSRTVPIPADSDGIAEEVCRTFNVARVSCGHIVAAGGLAFSGADSMVKAHPLEAFAACPIPRLGINIELPETLELRRRKAQSSKARTAVFFWLAVAVAGFYVYADRTDASAKIASDNARYLSTKKQLDSATEKLKGDIANESVLQTALANAFSPAQLPSDVIAEFTNKMPSDKMWTTGFTFERGKPLLIRGTALDSDSVAAYVQDLAIDPRLRDVKLVFANNGMIENKPIVEFSLQVHVMGNLPLNNPLKSTGGSHQ